MSITTAGGTDAHLFPPEGIRQFLPLLYPKTHKTNHVITFLNVFSNKTDCQTNDLYKF